MLRAGNETSWYTVWSMQGKLAREMAMEREGMNKPLPLGKFQAQEIERLLLPHLDQIAAQAMRELLAAEAFWREAIKGVYLPLDDNGDCQFCDNVGVGTHLDSCPWLLAQDGE